MRALRGSADRMVGRNDLAVPNLSHVLLWLVGRFTWTVRVKSPRPRACTSLGASLLVPTPPPTISFEAVIHCESTSQAVLRGMRAAHPSCESLPPARSVKTRRAPSRHCRDARISTVVRLLRPCMISSTLPPHKRGWAVSTSVYCSFGICIFGVLSILGLKL